MIDTCNCNRFLGSGYCLHLWPDPKRKDSTPYVPKPPEPSRMPWVDLFAPGGPRV